MLHYCHRMNYSKKNFKQGNFLSCLFDKTPEIFRLFYPWVFWTKQSYTSENSTKLCYTLLKFQGVKSRLMKLPHDFFLIATEKFSFFNRPLEFPHEIFIIPLDIVCPQLVCLYFSGIAKCQVHIPRIQN